MSTVVIQPGRFFFSYRFREQSNPDDCFADNLQFFFLELPRLQKIWESLETNLERWCYLFENLSNFAEMPKDPAGFEDVFSVAQTGTLDEEELQKYVTTMVTEYDKLVIGQYYHQEGKAEGLAEGEAKGKAEEKASIAKRMLDLGLAIPIIQQATGMTEEEIRAL